MIEESEFEFPLEFRIAELSSDLSLGVNNWVYFNFSSKYVPENDILPLIFEDIGERMILVR